MFCQFSSINEINKFSAVKSKNPIKKLWILWYCIGKANTCRGNDRLERLHLMCIGVIHQGKGGIA